MIQNVPCYQEIMICCHLMLFYRQSSRILCKRLCPSCRYRNEALIWWLHSLVCFIRALPVHCPGSKPLPLYDESVVSSVVRLWVFQKLVWFPGWSIIFASAAYVLRHLSHLLRKTRERKWHITEEVSAWLYRTTSIWRRTKTGVLQLFARKLFLKCKY